MFTRNGYFHDRIAITSIIGNSNDSTIRELRRDAAVICSRVFESDRLGPQVLVEGFLAEVLAKAGPLEASEGRRYVRLVVSLGQEKRMCVMIATSKIQVPTCQETVASESEAMLTLTKQVPASIFSET